MEPKISAEATANALAKMAEMQGYSLEKLLAEHPEFYDVYYRPLVDVRTRY